MNVKIRLYRIITFVLVYMARYGKLSMQSCISIVGLHNRRVKPTTTLIQCTCGVAVLVTVK